MFDLTNAEHFQDADKARTFLENMRWPNGPVCPHCDYCVNLLDGGWRCSSLPDPYFCHLPCTRSTDCLPGNVCMASYALQSTGEIFRVGFELCQTIPPHVGVCMDPNEFPCRP